MLDSHDQGSQLEDAGTVVPFVGLAKTVYCVGATLYDGRRREVAHVSAHIVDGKATVDGTWKLARSHRPDYPHRVTLPVAEATLTTGDCQRWIERHRGDLLAEAKRRAAAERAWAKMDAVARRLIRSDPRLWDHDWDVVDLAWHLSHPEWTPLPERLCA